ncbi:6-phosphofructokinase [Paracrocinitomix mangrovi]|uniref:6-phosphofructokinase n=1 Tax=Paracrocinitomix mangrovi TaxID=2862509 RepID=UPI001C8D3B80|nr:6-phosphofructokinase [Paracrocinitomix mangrovi]UKN03041.1 6-phosphofructokinase [Paracrocinitomix mangrovi]
MSKTNIIKAFFMSSKIRNIALLTSGGDSPGMNACIRAVVRAALYHDLVPYGVYDGLNGLIKNEIKELKYKDVSNILQMGGTILGTARCKEFHEKEFRAKAYENLAAKNIDALIAIGGDGTFMGMSIFSNEFDIPVIGIPGTIDNDINGTEYTIGFDTALNTIINSIDNIRDTAASHHRIFLVEVMGNNSGTLALYAAAASGAREVFMPEKKEDLIEIKEKVKKAIAANRSSIIIVSEGDEIGGAQQLYDYLAEQHLADKIRFSVLGHIQRGGRPTFIDRLNATLFGEKAVVSLLQGRSNIMIGIKEGKVATEDFLLSQEKKSIQNMEYLKLIRKLSVY